MDESPAGLRLRGGQAVDVDPWRALFGNPHLWPELTHMYIAGYIVAGLLVAGAYAWRWLRGERSRYVRTALVIPLTIAALAAPAQVVVGDWIARRVAEDQPLKLAAFEGLGETTDGRSSHISVAGTTTARSVGASRSPSFYRCSRTTTPRPRCRASTAVPPADRPP